MNPDFDMPIDETILLMYEDLREEGDLQKLIDEQIQEGLYLEFKKKKQAANGDLDDSDKRQFSRALSGFANSGGGVLLWGIEGDQSERASALKPITDVLRFQAALKKSLINSTQPIVDDVRVDVIFAAQSGTHGFIKCLIPQSEKTPHRSMAWDREYFKRSTEGFYRLEHFDLEDMFGRRPIPRLDLNCQITKGSTIGSREGNKQDVDIRITLVNSGRGSARAPFVELIANEPYEITPCGISSGADESIFRWLKETTSRAKFLGRSELVIHPETEFQFAVVRRRFWDRGNIGGDLSLRARLAAENGRLREIRFDFTANDLLRVVGWNGHTLRS